VTPPNQAPTANVGGPYTIILGQSLTLNGAASSDPDGDPLTYSWDVNGDGVFGDAAGVSPTLSAAQLAALGVTAPSTRNVTVRVDDGSRGVATAATTLTVLPASAGSLPLQTLTVKLIHIKGVPALDIVNNSTGAHQQIKLLPKPAPGGVQFVVSD